MKAIVHDTYGAPLDVLKLRDVEAPVAKDGQVLVRVAAAAINPPDWAIVRGTPYVVRLMSSGVRAPRNGVRGTDLAGTVEAVGPGVTRFTVGDEVFGAGVGTFAELAVAPEKNLVRRPANASVEQAAAVPMSGLTALHGLRDHGRLKAGQRVLITGAGGGIGTFAVQIAKALGAHVTAVCSTSKVELVRSLGADRVIDYTKEDFTAGDERYDLVLDNVVNLPLLRTRRVLTRTGTLMANGGQFDRHPWVASLGVVARAPLMSLFMHQRLGTFLSLPKTEDLQTLAELIESGKVTPVVGATFPLAEAAAALARFGEGHATGKIVITV